jgi:UDP-N-acetylglucosamine diphosphorylase / glucose-1-phosphate thymidylyltransferase / UDP-N-acetylgalactosamine diphosphorylase / glucosamine-1-phosphate N-acetyltransferase / galactosamine-1-phosphate N-acetyltransferase
MIAILLAAGTGRKFWPFNEVRNKCAFPVGNQPCVRRLAKQLINAGVEGLVVVVGPHSGSIRAALSESSPFYSGLDERVRYVVQPEPAGTADAVVRALDEVGDQPCLVACADVVTTAETIEQFIAAAKSKAPAVAVVQPLGTERPGDWIIADLKEGALTAFEGHGREGSHRLCGLYAFQEPALRYLRSNPGMMTHVPVGGMPLQEAEIAESLARMSEEGLTVAGIEPHGFFVDLDKPWHILEANERLLRDFSSRHTGNECAEGSKVAESADISGRVMLSQGAEIGERVIVRGDVWLGPGAKVLNGSIIQGNAWIGANTVVRDYALVGENSVLGPDAICGHGAEFEGVLLEGAYLYHYCEIFGVVGAKVDIGAATVCGTLRFDDGGTVHRVGGRPEVPQFGANASYLGDYSRTGVNAILMPGVKTGAYSCVGAGVVLYEDLPSRELVLVRQELIRRPWGPERYGW